MTLSSTRYEAEKTLNTYITENAKRRIQFDLLLGEKKGVDLRSKNIMSNYNTSNSISSFSMLSDINAHNVENVTSNKLSIFI